MDDKYITLKILDIVCDLTVVAFGLVIFGGVSYGIWNIRNKEQKETNR